MYNENGEWAVVEGGRLLNDTLVISSVNEKNDVRKYLLIQNGIVVDTIIDDDGATGRGSLIDTLYAIKHRGDAKGGVYDLNYEGMDRLMITEVVEHGLKNKLNTEDER